jgi:hypothetical protein
MLTAPRSLDCFVEVDETGDDEESEDTPHEYCNDTEDRLHL